MSSATLPSGATLRGLAYANSSAYLGIRFAQPPVGDLRWRAPSPFAHARGKTYNATAFGLPCIQEVEPFSEDCLFLNVFAPRRASKLPILVYIHGGCFMADSTRNALFNGTHLVELAARGASGAVPVILVTIQYRLGVYGWLGGDALRDTSGATGNWGLMDQRLALRWVRENIGAFGGDPDRVTLFGHSAGAAAVSAHLVSPASTGLFSRAGVISGTMANWGSHSAEAAERNFEHALASVNCSTLACLLDVAATDPARLQRAARWSWKGRTPCRDGCSFAPVIDGVEQLDWPLAVARRATSLNVSFGRVPLLHGTTLDDGYGFVKNDNFFNLTNDATPPQCDSYVRGAWGAALSANLTSLYPPSSYKPWPPRDSLCFVAAARMETDFAYACTARQASRLSAAPVYRYLFSMHTPDGADAEWVPHGHDLPFVFQVDTDPTQATAPARALARTMLGYWTRFAASGDPAGGWPRFDQGEQLMRLDANVSTAAGWHDFECDTWDRAWPTIGECTPTPV